MPGADNRDGGDGGVVEGDHLQVKTIREEAIKTAEPREALKLKHPEAEVSPEEPWRDDALGRKQLAERLTGLIRNQQEPFVLSIDGHWGSGKSFLLKRWQRELEIGGFRAIYYNAWEDDFCDDPLLSIIGQMWEQFREGKVKELAKQVGQIAVQLIKQNLIAVPSKLTGIDLSVDLSKLDSRDLLEEYSNQRKTKDCLKKQLTQLSASVLTETRHPLVFIIDELDRCRPTFAIELLERVKHIFDVRGLVFVFGVNRAELCKSLQSVYGEIDADLYLHRFFDLGFSLPVTNADSFCRSLMDRYGLEEHFRMRAHEYNRLAEGFPNLCVRLGLSLREIDHCVKLIAVAAMTLSEKQSMFPHLLAFLIPLKLKNPLLYRQFIQRERRASELLNFVEEFEPHFGTDHYLDEWLLSTEAYLYAVEAPGANFAGESSALEQLRLMEIGGELTHPELLSDRTKASENGRIDRLLQMIASAELAVLYGRRRSTLVYLDGLIDFKKAAIM